MARSANGESFSHYLPYSAEDEKLGMVCTTAGSAEIAAGSVYPPRKEEHPEIFRPVAVGRTLPEFQLVYIARGKGEFAVDETRRDVKEGNMLLILPGMRHRYKPDEEVGWHEYWVGFKGDFFDRLLDEKILSRDVTVFETGLRESILDIFGRIFDEVREERPLYQLKACAGILSLIAEMLSVTRRKEQPGYYQEVVERAKYLMGKNLFGEINMPAIARRIGVSTSRLNEIFRTYTAMTPYQYYIHMKINRAKSLLDGGEESVQSVARRLGFEDPFYFSRLFKSKTGVAPSKWKPHVR